MKSKKGYHGARRTEGVDIEPASGVDANESIKQAQLLREQYREDFPYLENFGTDRAAENYLKEKGFRQIGKQLFENKNTRANISPYTDKKSDELSLVSGWHVSYWRVKHADHNRR